ncbi:MAG: trypsin-like serine protease [Nitrospirales bacterium]
MRRHNPSVGVIHSTVLAFAIGLGGSSYAGAEEPTSLSTPSDDSVIERAVPRDHRTKPGFFTPSQKALAPAAQPTPQGKVLIPQAAPSSGGGGPLPVVGGTFEPDYRYPWVVRMGGCGGVLIDPEWVLTAAHCVTPGIGFGQLTYKRTDPYTGAVKTETRGPAPVGARRDGVYLHPNYTPSQDQANDIALIKLAQPFTINPYLQTVGLPRNQRNPGVVGTLASFSHNGTPPSGQFAIFRAPIPQIDYAPKINIPATAASASLCPGDSGSGFVTVENGRATVRGIASQGNTTNCLTPNGEAVFTDVFTFRAWILQTMGKTDPSLVGNTRVRWSGRMAHGRMIVACFNPYGNLEGPLNVVGVEEGTVCESGQTQTIMCNLDKNQGNVGVMVPTLSGLTVRTTMSNGTSQVQTLPPSGSTASFFGLLPAGASREFTCQIGTATTTGGIGGVGGMGAVLSRGIEEGQTTEPIIEQPSPFDLTEGSKQ